MTAGSLTALTVIYFVTAVVTVVTGSTTLIAVPVMLQFGLEPRTAVATNMLALGMLSFGGMLPFVNTPAIDRVRLWWLVALTMAGSVLGALLLFAVPPKWMTLIIPVAMIVVLVLLLFEPGLTGAESKARSAIGFVVAGLLAVYGGFLSGGYATLLVAGGMLLFRYPLLRAIAMSRVLNAASSLIAVVVFARHGIIDWRLGGVLSVAAFIGGLLGTHWAQKMPAILLRRLFLGTVAALAVKSLLFDVPWRELMLL